MYIQLTNEKVNGLGFGPTQGLPQLGQPQSQTHWTVPMNQLGPTNLAYPKNSLNQPQLLPPTVDDDHSRSEIPIIKAYY